MKDFVVIILFSLINIEIIFFYKILNFLFYLLILSMWFLVNHILINIIFNYLF